LAERGGFFRCGGRRGNGDGLGEREIMGALVCFFGEGLRRPMKEWGGALA